MHDPSTVLGDFPPRALQRLFPWLPTLVTLWHDDPCLDGSDDYCTHASIGFTDADQAWIKEHAKREWETWFSARYGRTNLSGCSYSEVLFSAWTDVRWHVARIPHRTPLRRWELSSIALLASNPIDDLRCAVRDAKESAQGLERLLWFVLRFYRTQRRPWWRHRRWHVMHWRFQIRPVQTFKRWAFSHCDECGGSFTWREVAKGQVISTQWDGPGPRWFNCVERILHFRCHGERSKRQAKDYGIVGGVVGGVEAFLRGSRFRKDN